MQKSRDTRGGSLSRTRHTLQHQAKSSWNVENTLQKELLVECGLTKTASSPRFTRLDGSGFRHWEQVLSKQLKSPTGSLVYLVSIGGYTDEDSTPTSAYLSSGEGGAGGVVTKDVSHIN